MQPNDMPADSATQLFNVLVHQRTYRVWASDARCAFWERVNAGLWEPQTFDVFQRFLRPNRCYIDLGAWIGPTVLYGATLSRCVHALEPDPVAFAELSRNVGINSRLRHKIHLHAFGIAAQTGTAQLFVGGLYYGQQSQFGDSMSGLIAASGELSQPSHEVQCMDLERFLELRAIDDCNFVKMDIEGGEYAVIPGLWRRLQRFGMPTLYVSFHAPELARRERLIQTCVEELLLCYSHFYRAADARAVPLLKYVDAVHDWGDEAPGSPWSRLENVLGIGLVATTEEW